MNSLATRLPAEGEIVFVATGDPGANSAVLLRKKIDQLLPCVVDPARYAALRSRIWGIVSWAPPNLPALLGAHGAPPGLAWLHQSGVGMEAIARLDLPAGLTVTNIKGADYYAAPMAEHVVARMLEWAKGLPALWGSQAERIWRQFEPPTLAGKTVMIFGSGAIGRAVAARLAGFDMRLIVVRRSNREAPVSGSEVIGLAEARVRLAETDYIILALPLTAETHGLIDASDLEHMRPDVFIVNVGRAALIDEAALAAALRKGRIGGVALDVFWREPLASGDDVWSWPRTAITPHMSANRAGGNADLIADTAVETLRRILAGESLANRVDLPAGY